MVFFRKFRWNNVAILLLIIYLQTKEKCKKEIVESEKGCPEPAHFQKGYVRGRRKRDRI